MTNHEGNTALAKVEGLKRRRRRRKWLVSALVLLALAGAWMSWQRWPDLFGAAEAPPEPLAVEPTPAQPRAEREPPRPPGPGAPTARQSLPQPPTSAPPLPGLDASDSRVREEAASLSADPQLAEWLGVDDVLRRVVLAVVNVREGTNPRKLIAPIGPEVGFATLEGDDGRITARTGGYVRFDAFAGLVAGFDPRQCARLFERFEPLLDEAYAELGFPGASFRNALIEAAGEILATPEVDGEPELVFHVNHYRYADPALEELSPVQKQLLRTGPDNARRIRSKVREVALALGAEERVLPRAPRYRVDDR